MASKTSTEVTDLGVSCDFLLTALVRQGPEVAEILTQLVSPHREDGDEEPAFLASTTARGRRLGASFNQLVEADLQVYAVNSTLTVLRLQRDDLTPALANEIVRLRRKIQGHYLAPNMDGLGLQSPRLRVSKVLLRQGGTIDERFGRDDLDAMLGAKADEDDPFDPRQAAAAVIATTGELQTTVKLIRAAQRDLERARIERDRIKAEHGELFVYTARSFEADCRLAGMRELAAKVRPSERQPGRRAEEEEEAPPPLPEEEGPEAIPGEEDATA
ncbi:MAG TPA: hypothetical protein VGG06_31975 [Thermoanaerobaculia bacterium]|jgi:hypothetical protein